MLFKRDYYTQAKQMRNETAQQVQDEKAQMSEAELAEEKEKTEQGFQELLQKVHERAEEKKRRGPDPLKVQRFQKLILPALELASLCAMDIVIDMSDLKGHIKLETDCVVMQKGLKPSPMDLFGELLRGAAGFDVYKKEETIVFWLDYDLDKDD